MKVKLRELFEIKERLREINDLPFDSIEWIGDHKKKIEVSNELKEEFTLSGMSNKDFIDFLEPADWQNPQKQTGPAAIRIKRGPFKGKMGLMQGHWKTITGKSWAESDYNEAINYSMRRERDGLPPDDQVYYVTIEEKSGPRDRLLHAFEIEDPAPGKFYKVFKGKYEGSEFLYEVPYPYWYGDADPGDTDPVGLDYAMRRTRERLPDDRLTYYGIVHGKPVVLHQSEFLDTEDETE